MGLVNITADFSRLVSVLEDISLSLKHGIRILEAAFPVKPAEQWNIRPQQEIRIVGDEELIEREEEDDRKQKQARESEEHVFSLEDFYDL